MKVIKKILIVILTIININIVVSLIVSFNFQKVIVDGVVKETFKSAISSNNYKEPNIQINESATSSKDLVTTSDERINKILESDAIQELIQDYMDKTLKSLDNPEELENIDFEQDVINYLKENKDVIETSSGVEITDEMLNETKENLEERDFNKLVKQKIRNTSNNMTQQEKEVLKLYSFIISKKFKIFLGLLFLIISVIITILINPKHKVINNIGLSLLIGGLETIIMSFVLKFIIINHTNLTNFNIGSLINCSLIITIIGLIVILVYNSIVKLMKRRMEKAYE